MISMMSEEKQSFVTFETRAVEDRNASLAAGHWVGVDKDYAVITPAGGTLTVEREVDEFLFLEPGKEKFKALYDKWKTGQEIPLDGVPVRTWPVLSPAQVNLLLSMNIRTVEELATLNESGVGRLGMDGPALREKARSWLAAAGEQGKTASRIEELELRNKELQEIIKERDATIAEMAPREDQKHEIKLLRDLLEKEQAKNRGKK